MLGCIVLAEAAHRLAERYDILIGLHTDHCQPEKAAGFLKPLIEATAKRRANGQGNLFQSHMLDASILPLEENMAISKEYLELCAANEIILEVEAGVVGGEEDGSAGTEDMPAEKLYTTPEDMLIVYESLNGIGRYMFAATFGNVHGAYKPGAVKLRPDILKQGQDAVTGKHGEAAKFDLVFHGGSGSEKHQIKETLEYGVIKMNIDTDTQYAFTRPIADHMMANYAGGAEDRRRGRQQEGVRPALLPQESRASHGRPPRRGLQRPREHQQNHLRHGLKNSPYFR